MACCCGQSGPLPLPQHGALDLFSNDVGGEELSEETMRDFGRNFMGDETILFSSTSISQGTPMAAIPIKHSVKARVNHGDVNADTGQMTLAEFGAQLANLCQEHGVHLDDTVRDRVIKNITVSPSMKVMISNQCIPAMFQARSVLFARCGPTSVCVRVYVLWQRVCVSFSG